MLMAQMLSLVVTPLTIFSTAVMAVSEVKAEELAEAFIRDYKINIHKSIKLKFILSPGTAIHLR